MAKRHKVKRYYGGRANFFRAKPRFITVVFAALLLAGLGYVGTVIYEPAYDFIMNIGKAPESGQPEQEPEPSEADAPAEEAEPPPPAEPVYQAVRAVYAPPEIVSDPALFDSFLDGLDKSYANAVMIDIKSVDGEVLFLSENEAANSWGVVSPDAADLKAVAEKLDGRGLMLAVKMSVFRDPKAASAGRLDYAINYRDSNYLWLDDAAENGGKPWLNPYSALTRAYIESLMLEAIDSGARLVALEDTRFPDNSAIYASFGSESDAVTRSEALKSVIDGLTETAEKKDAQVAAYFPLTELTDTELEENRYGGGILKTVGGFIMPGIGPSLFGGSFNRNGLEINGAQDDPGAAVKAALSYVKAAAPLDTKVIPVLEGGESGFMKSQIDAVKELQVEEYILYSADGKYDF